MKDARNSDPPFALSPSKGHPHPPPVIPNRREESKIHRPQPVCPCNRKPPAPTDTSPLPTPVPPLYHDQYRTLPQPQNPTPKPTLPSKCPKLS